MKYCRSRGRSWATSLLMGYFAFCLMLVVSTIQSRFPSWGYFCSILSHREMRQKLFEIRIQRNAVRAICKKYSNKVKARARRAREA